MVVLVFLLPYFSFFFVDGLVTTAIAFVVFFFFFFKQKTAYEIGVRLVGSEMCIRDRFLAGCGVNALSGLQKHANSIYCRDHVGLIRRVSVASGSCCRIRRESPVSYTHLTLPTKRIVETSGGAA